MAGHGEYTVLLIDDDASFREIVRSLLGSHGLQVIEATTGQQAAQFLELETLHLIIVDGVLPDTSGLDWISELRSTGKHGGAPVVYASSRWPDLASYKRLTSALAVQQVIHKPIVPLAFLEQMLDLIKRSHAPGTVFGTKVGVSPTLAQIAAKYISELPTRLDELRKAIRAAKMDPAAAASARLQAHKIRGTAGSFELNKLGELLGTIEDKIDAADPHSLCEADFWTSMEEIVTRATTLLPGRTATLHASPAEVPRPGGLSVALARILVVDDDPSFLSMMEALGHQRLIEIVPASTRRQAIDLMKVGKFDGAILDLHLETEELSFDLARTIRDISGQETFPLAFVSASTEVDNRVAAAQAGAALYLTKPLGPDALEAAVQHLVAIQRREQRRILIVDDDHSFTETVSAVFQSLDIQVHSLCEPVRILESMHEANPDLVLLDIMMPGISGFDICKMLRTVPRWQDVPIIFLSEETSIETRIAAFLSGCDDYLPKAFAEEELITRVAVRIERAGMLKQRSEKDATTGLWMRRPFMEQANAMLSGAKKQGFPVAVAMVDLDHLKAINDSKGHLSGDGVLAGLGRLIGSRFGLEAVHGRWGGDEFIIASPGDNDTIETAAQDFIAEFHNIAFTSETGHDFAASASMGLSFFPQDGQTLHELVSVADRRLYRAKEQGRNRVVSKG